MARVRRIAVSLGAAPDAEALSGVRWQRSGPVHDLSEEPAVRQRRPHRDPEDDTPKARLCRGPAASPGVWASFPCLKSVTQKDCQQHYPADNCQCPDRDAQ
jgi:hypothetical protein